MSNISGFRLRVLLAALFAIMLLEGVLDIHAAPLDSLNGGIAAQEATGNGKVNQSSQSKTKEDPDKKKKKKFGLPGSIVAAPLPIVSPAIGAGIIPAVGYIFPFGKDDKISPPSTVGAAGLITNNGSSGFGLGAQLFMKENKYAITSLYVQGNVNYNLYGVGTAAGDANLKIPLDQTGHLYFGEALRRIPWQFFVGPRFWTGDSVVTVRPSNGETAAPPCRPRPSHNSARFGFTADARHPPKPLLPHRGNVHAVHIRLFC